MNPLINIDNLKQYMKSNNITETQFARLIKVDYTTVYRVLRGQRKPGAKFIAGLINNANINLKYEDIFLE